MKIRTGFVSNSSTSSFICEICGGTEAGMDISLSEVGMIECQTGHVYHTDCASSFVKTEEHMIEDKYGGEQVSEDFCPVCTLKVVSDDTMLKYVLHETGQNKIKLTQELQGRFPNLKALMASITPKK